MATPYDGKIYLVQVKGQFIARKSISDVARLITDSAPNVDGVFLQTSQGKEWQGKFDNDPKEINGPAEIAQWVSGLSARGLETHVWGIPKGRFTAEEAQRFIEAAKTPGVKSLCLDVEHGEAYYNGTAADARTLMQLIRDALGWDYHIGLILDARRNRPLNIYVDPFLPFVNSLHPMVYPKDFAKPVEAALDTAFGFLDPYDKPIIPMLQSYNATPPADITAQGNYAFLKGATGISYFCLGDRHMGTAEMAAVAAVKSPVAENKSKTAQTVEKLPAGAVGLWPDDARGYTEHIYENVAARPWHDFRDIYGHDVRWKLTSSTNDVAVAYTPILPAPGRYSVEVFIPKDNADSKRADYHVTYYENNQKKDRQIKIDQSSRSDEWVSLGMFDLDPRRAGDGRVNITDFSDEQPSQAVAFAGVRWVPAAAVKPAETKPTSQAQQLAQQGPTGVNKPATPATTPTPATVGAQVTNQDVINAFIVVGKKFGESWQTMISQAGLNSIYANRNAAYSGPAIASLPSLANDRKSSLVETLKMPAADLAKAAVAASKSSEPATPATVSQPAAKGQGKIDGRTWGVHGSAGSAAPPRNMWNFWIDELKAMGIKWYKQCDSRGPEDNGDGSIFRWVLALRDAGLTPIVRYQMGNQFPNRLDNAHFEKMKMYVREGVTYAEIGNEPNLVVEWQWSPEEMSWQAGRSIPVISEVWLNDAERTVSVGARPAWYAMAPTDWRGGINPVYSGPKFQELCWRYIGSDSNRKARAQAIFRNGGWVAVHAAVYEFPVDFDPINYPASEGPNGRGPWDMCLRGYELPIKYIADNIGVTIGGPGNPPIMSTESGVFTRESHSMGGHEMYASDDIQADLMVKMFNYLEQANLMQAMMPWTLAVCDEIGLNNRDFPGDGWYYNEGGLKSRSVVSKLKSVKAQRG